VTPPPPQTIPVIFNPTAGGGRARRRRRRLERAVAGTPVDLTWRATRAAGHATELAAEAAAAGCPLVLAFGGDGTYNEVARGLLGSDTAMGVLPAGTTSVLAYELGIPRPVDRALEALCRGRDRAVRVGQTDQGGIFLLMLSAGPDTVVLQRLGPLVKRLGGRLGVALQAIRELVRLQPMPRLTVSCDDHHIDEAGWAIVGKARCYAGPFAATPGADLAQPHLEAVVQLRSGRVAAVPFVADLARSRHQLRADVSRFTTSRIRIDAADGGRLAYQIDGDVAGALPVEAGVHPLPLKLRFPARPAHLPG
jgi:diacylglycerol kinase family enzyme